MLTIQQGNQIIHRKIVDCVIMLPSHHVISLCKISAVHIKRIISPTGSCLQRHRMHSNSLIATSCIQFFFHTSVFRKNVGNSYFLTRFLGMGGHIPQTSSPVIFFFTVRGGERGTHSKLIKIRRDSNIFAISFV